MAKIKVGNSVGDEINTTSEVDHWDVRLTSGQTYNFEVNGSGGFDPLDPTLTLRDSNGFIQALDWFPSGDFSADFDFSPTVTGDYTIDVAGAFDNTGDYILSVDFS
jgi:hypothetical protein